MTKQLKHRLENDVSLVARVGVYLDDPYGDGIRLEAIREPRPARVAAIQTIQTGPDMFDTKLIMDEYLEKVYQFLRKDMKRKHPQFGDI